MIRATCSCGKTYNLDDKFAGRRTRCKKCNAEFRVPNAAAGAAPVASALEAVSVVPAAPSPKPAVESAAAPAPAPVGLPPTPENELPKLQEDPDEWKPGKAGKSAAKFEEPEEEGAGAYDLAAPPPEAEPRPDPLPPPVAGEATASASRDAAAPPPRGGTGRGVASRPGGMSVNFFKYYLNYPSSPMIYVAATAFFAATTAIRGVPIYVTLGVVGSGLWLMIKDALSVRAKFATGDVNPGVVISVHPPLVAVRADMRTGGRPMPAIHIAKHPIAGLGEPPAKVGTRVAVVCHYYGPPDNNAWRNLDPTLIGCSISDQEVAQQKLASIRRSEWESLEQEVKKLKSPKPGLYTLWDRNSHGEKHSRTSPIAALVTVLVIGGGIAGALFGKPRNQANTPPAPAPVAVAPATPPATPPSPAPTPTPAPEPAHAAAPVATQPPPSPPAPTPAPAAEHLPAPVAPSPAPTATPPPAPTEVAAAPSPAPTPTPAPVAPVAPVAPAEPAKPALTPEQTTQLKTERAALAATLEHVQAMGKKLDIILPPAGAKLLAKDFTPAFTEVRVMARKLEKIPGLAPETDKAMDDAAKAVLKITETAKRGFDTALAGHAAKGREFFDEAIKERKARFDPIEKVLQTRIADVDKSLQ